VIHFQRVRTHVTASGRPGARITSGQRDVELLLQCHDFDLRPAESESELV